MIKRKYSIYKKGSEVGIATFPIDGFHRDIPNTIAGGFIDIDKENKIIKLYGKSQDFGKPTFKQVKQAILNNGDYLTNFDEDYKWYFDDSLILFSNINNNESNYSDNWQVYIGDYDKFEYDVKLHNGTIIENCYPNSGKFHPYNQGKAILEEDVAEIRFSNNPKMCLDNDYSKFEVKFKEVYETQKQNNSDIFSPRVTQYRQKLPKIGRNDSCTCGSGKKFKNCCINKK